MSLPLQKTKSFSIPNVDVVPKSRQSDCSAVDFVFLEISVSLEDPGGPG